MRRLPNLPFSVWFPCCHRPRTSTFPATLPAPATGRGKFWCSVPALPWLTSTACWSASLFTTIAILRSFFATPYPLRRAGNGFRFTERFHINPIFRIGTIPSSHGYVLQNMERPALNMPHGQNIIPFHNPTCELTKISPISFLRD